MKKDMELIMIRPVQYFYYDNNGEFIVAGKQVSDGSCLKTEKVIFHDPATIVYWEDGTKSVVKCSEGDKYDPEKGFALAVAKKVYGSYTNFEKQMKKGNTP